MGHFLHKETRPEKKWGIEPSCTLLKPNPILYGSQEDSRNGKTLPSQILEILLLEDSCTITLQFCHRCLVQLARDWLCCYNQSLYKLQFFIFNFITSIHILFGVTPFSLTGINLHLENFFLTNIGSCIHCNT